MWKIPKIWLKLRTDYVIIEAVLVDDGLRYKQLSVGIKAKNGDIIRIIPISTMLM